MDRRGGRRQRSEPGLAGCFETLLRVAFLGLNYLMMAAGLALVGYSIYIFKGIRYPHPGSASGDDCTLGQSNNVLHLEHKTVHHMAGADAQSAWEDVKPYWFGFVVVAMGVWTFITALFALGGARCDKACCLGTHTVMLLVALLAEGTFGLVFYFDKGWNWELPTDESGQCKEFRKFVQKHLRTSLYIVLAVLILQLCSLLLGCAMWSWATERKQDEDEEAEMLRRPLAPSKATSVPGRDPGQSKRKTDRWSMRMREEYGLDTGKFSYDPEVPKGGPAEVSQQRAEMVHRRHNCSLM